MLNCINPCLFEINLNIYHVLGVTYVVLTTNVIKESLLNMNIKKKEEMGDHSSDYAVYNLH